MAMDTGARRRHQTEHKAAYKITSTLPRPPSSPPPPSLPPPPSFESWKTGRAKTLPPPPSSLPLPSLPPPPSLPPGGAAASAPEKLAICVRSAEASGAVTEAAARQAAAPEAATPEVLVLEAVTLLMAAKDAAASKWHENLSSLAALVHALEQTPPDVATLAELSDLLAKAKTATDRLLAQRPADTPVVVIHESLDETLNAQLAALSVLEVAFKVGDHVHLKDTDRMLKRGVVVRVDPGPPARFDVKATDGVLHEGWPSNSLKLQELVRDHASQAVSKPVIFTMRCPGKMPAKKALPPAAEKPVTAPAAQLTASGAEPAAAAQLKPTTAPPSEPTAAAPLAAPLPPVPRMPRLLVVLDTNELLQPLPCPIDREYLMQACLGVEILVPRTVLAELDGLKNHSDSALAGRAR